VSCCRAQAAQRIRRARGDSQWLRAETTYNLPDARRIFADDARQRSRSPKESAVRAIVQLAEQLRRELIRRGTDAFNADFRGAPSLPE